MHGTENETNELLRQALEGDKKDDSRVQEQTQKSLCTCQKEAISEMEVWELMTKKQWVLSVIF